MNRKFLFLVASARREGNTEALARIAASTLPESVTQQWIHLDELPLERLEDIRHHPERNDPWPLPEGNERILLDATLTATDIVFVTPVYWYSLPSSAKLYLEQWSGWMRTPGVDFKKQMTAKKLWTICVLADEDPSRAELLVATLRLSAEYMKMGWGGELIGHGSRPGDVLKDRRALEAAGHFFAVATAPAHASRN